MADRKMRVCKECGKLFEPMSNRQLYCKEPHYRACPVCGTMVCIKSDRLCNPNPVACSYKCRAELTKQTSLKLYGCTAPGNSKAAREKARQTMLDRYGAEYTLCSDILSRKVRDTVTRVYGVDNVSKAESVKLKRANTCLNKYGSKSNLGNPHLRSLYRIIMVSRYGCAYPLQNKTIKHKQQTTCMAKYGAPTPVQSEQVKIKIKNTLMGRYGVDSPFASFSVREKSKDAFLQRFGVDNPFKLDAFQNKASTTILNKYGVDNAMKNPVIKLKHDTTMLKKYGTIHALQNPKLLDRMLSTRDRTIHDNLYFGILPQMSRVNRYAYDALVSNGFNVICEFRIDRFYYDLFLPDIGLLIEINPSYTHSILGCHFNKNGKPIDYHYNKATTATKYGYQCVNVFDWIDLDELLGSIIEGRAIITEFIGKPVLHWFNCKNKTHLVDDMYHHCWMISNGFLPVYDSGQAIHII